MPLIPTSQGGIGLSALNPDNNSGLFQQATSYRGQKSDERASQNVAALLGKGDKDAENKKAAKQQEAIGKINAATYISNLAHDQYEAGTYKNGNFNFDYRDEHGTKRTGTGGLGDVITERGDVAEDIIKQINNATSPLTLHKNAEKDFIEHLPKRMMKETKKDIINQY